MSTMVFLYTTAPDAKTAKGIASALVEARLAACVNIVPGMISVYRWKGVIESAEEVVLIVKTTGAAAEEARGKILSLHPFETPCVASLPASGPGASAAFLSWVEGETKS